MAAVAQTQQSTEQKALTTTTSEAVVVVDTHPAVDVAVAKAVLTTNLREVTAMTGKGKRRIMQQMLRMVPQKAAGDMLMLAVALAEKMGGRAVAVEEEEAQQLQRQLRKRQPRPQRQRTERTACFPLHRMLLAVRSNTN